MHTWLYVRPVLAQRCIFHFGSLSYSVVFGQKVAISEGEKVYRSWVQRRTKGYS